MKIFLFEDNEERIDFFKKIFKDHTLVQSSEVLKAEALFESEKPFDLLLLDHDMDGGVYVDSNEPNTGYQLVKFLVNYKKDLENSEIIIHSMYWDGALKMHQLLDINGISSIMMPFPIVQKILSKVELSGKIIVQHEAQKIIDINKYCDNLYNELLKYKKLYNGALDILFDIGVTKKNGL